ncbi:hypothetical protein D3C71_1367520 [compost metagenome]
MRGEPGAQATQRRSAPHHQVGARRLARHIRSGEVDARYRVNVDAVALPELQRVVRQAHARVRRGCLSGWGQIDEPQSCTVLSAQQRSARDGMASLQREISDGEDGARGHG